MNRLTGSASEHYDRWKRDNPELAKLEKRLDQLLNLSGCQSPERLLFGLGAKRGGFDLLSACAHRTIYDDSGHPYLTRTYLARRDRHELPGVFLHYFHRSDSDRELHNHPWESGVAFVLTGGYVEHRMEGRNGNIVQRFVPPFSVNMLRAETFHRVELARAHCWTLFVAGPRRQERTAEAEGWGFIDLETRRFEDVVERDCRLGHR